MPATEVQATERPSGAGGVVTMGESLVLLSSERPVPLAHVDGLRLGFAGAESNVAIGVARLGVPATWIGRLGADPFAERIIRELRAEGVDMRVVEDEDAPTAFMVKEHRTAARTRVHYYRRHSAGSRLCPEDVDEEAVSQAAVLHLTGITPGLSETASKAVRHAVDVARGAGVPLTFDVNHRAGVWRERNPVAVYRELADESAVLFAGEDEARLLLGAGDHPTPHELMAALVTRVRGDVVLKLGAAGCLASIDGTLHEVPAVPVVPYDTVGAGDAFVAGYLAELCLRAPAAVRLRTAVQSGALACLSAGDWEGLPRRADLAVSSSGDPVIR